MNWNTVTGRSESNGLSFLTAAAVLLLLFLAKTLPWLLQTAEKTGIWLGLYALLQSIALFLLWKRADGIPRWLEKWRLSRIVKHLLLGFSLFILAGFAYGFSSTYLELEPPPEASLNMQVGLLGSVLLFLTMIQAAVLEEWLFRAYLLGRLLSTFGPFFAISISSLVFAAYHLSLFQFLSTCLLGLCLGYLFWREGSLNGPLVAHVTFNSLGFIFFLLQPPA